MDYAGTRELVRLRYELRRLLAERPPGADAAARAVIRRIIMEVPELARWQVSLAVSPAP